MITPLTSLTKEILTGKTILVRVDFNVQVFEGKVLDDLRIRKTIPTIEFLRGCGAKIILMSHIESKDGTGLKPVCEYIRSTYASVFGDVTFVEDFRKENTKDIVSAMKDGDVVLFENLRIDEGEKKNDPRFVDMLASYGELYVNDAFAVSHREHASVVGLPQKFISKSYAGIQLEKEIHELKKAFSPQRPFVFILGGAKFETKLPLIEKFKHADYVYIGGALLNDILKAKGFEVGKSLVSSTEFDMSGVLSMGNVVIPEDVVVQTGQDISIKKIDEVGAEDLIMDVGPSMTLKLEQTLKSAKFVLWNGPMGNYEKGYKDQTIGMAKAVISSTEEGNAYALLGGGDTTAALASLGVEESTNKNLFVSTGGGAMLEYLQQETLPGIDALK